MSQLYVVVGLGASGVSSLKYLLSKNCRVAAMDTRAAPPNLEWLVDYPQVENFFGGFDEALLSKANIIVLSPGISVHETAIAKARAQGILVIGDIELFLQATTVPVIAITGSNAKSTVTTLVGLMAQASGLRTQVGGNLGIPALELLDLNNPPDVYVLELSSFQLETTFSLQAQVACVLNVTPDHMDRYTDFEHYKQTKLLVYKGCHIAVCNRDDPSTECGNDYQSRRFYFTLNTPVQNEFGLLKVKDQSWLAFEEEALMPVTELPVRGRHYQANALAALAIGHSFGFNREAMLKVLRDFKGLPHRCQFVCEKSEVSWYNDSKGTNVGATLAAIEGLGAELEGKVLLIAGGVGKSADFSPLLPAVEKYVRTLILIGEAAQTLAEVLGKNTEVVFASSMQEAITLAEQKAHPGDCVLLSPACASYDMFRHFEHRGELFVQLVQEL